MAISDDQYQTLLSRITKLEHAVNDVIVALDRKASLTQLSELVTLLQTDLVDLRTKTTALESRVTAIENEPLL